ncbi:hypothetical protein E5A74_10375 [Sphingomonas naasensis]|uniref:Uncharacterized protein n=1 Tax=Sphingomonas naasensis TaxID=1344951 RepID=A0A4S1WGN5_9SPHN|nr:hypothetical protein [Sphingomonas naasensis]TGX42254.1 hypothetical protein E5A74_10375 [Sphingomonas naasensis]
MPFSNEVEQPIERSFERRLAGAQLSQRFPPRGGRIGGQVEPAGQQFLESLGRQHTPFDRTRHDIVQLGHRDAAPLAGAYA